MIDENGFEITEKQLLKEAMILISEALCLLYESKSTEGIAAAFMGDSLLKYMQVIYRGDDVLLASADYTKYEEEVYLREKKHIRIIK